MPKLNKYHVIRGDRAAIKCGRREVVFDCLKHDYGCAGEDTRRNGIEYVSVTRDMYGDYPFFTIPREDLELVAEVEVPNVV